MVAAFGGAGARVGLYSTHQQWDEIVGRVPAASPLTGLPSWLSAAVTERGAAENCTHAPLTAGPVVLAQWTDGDLDYDLACRQFRVAPVPTVRGTAAIGSRLTAHAGAWAPGGVALAYRWLRNGAPISGATGSSYVVRSADAGARISVRVTGTKLAYSRATRTSAAVRVAGALRSARPTITGAALKGATLTVHAGAWSPAPVRLSYEWRRNGRPIAGATGRHHVVTAADLGARITVRVTGRKAGWATASRTSASVAVAAAQAVVRPSSVASSLATPSAPSPAPTLTPTPAVATPTPIASPTAFPPLEGSGIIPFRMGVR
jgi:hypothetical protein